MGKKKKNKRRKKQEEVLSPEILAQTKQVNYLLQIENAEEGSGDFLEDVQRTQDAFIRLLQALANHLVSRSPALANRLLDTVNYNITLE